MHVIHYSLEQVHRIPSNCSVATVILTSLKSCLLEKPLEGDQLPVFELTPLPFGTASLPSRMFPVQFTPSRNLDFSLIYSFVHFRNTSSKLPLALQKESTSIWIK